ncbi:hypothetical protein [Streptomyces sp. CBMA123]|uniref:hypothetical protein n=1 Tax=Streptomyces sp. CBMA123 TaxID=1896313 RepID=UPI001661D870|nr:hypothetical protein [Streptomyces sp. CBMA123]MBD0689055.1 hypothetical protein [Streptomyces sp. CBMA123]
MTTPSLQTDDASVQRILASLEHHLGIMKRAATQVTDVNDEVQKYFQAACSTQYQQKINDWLGRYQQLQGAYDTFHGAFSAGHGKINTAHEEALGLTGQWGGGSGISDNIRYTLNP